MAGDNFGLVICNEEYEPRMKEVMPGATLDNLPTVKPDRQKMVTRIGKKFFYNFDLMGPLSQNNFDCSKTEIRDLYENIDDIEFAVKIFVKDLKGEVEKVIGKGGSINTLLVYFLGHGCRVQSKDCLLGVNGRPYPVNSMLEHLITLKFDKLILILDCCRNNIDLKTFHPDYTKDIQAQLDHVDTMRLSYDKVTRIYSAQEGHTSTDKAGATFADALDQLLTTHTESVDEEKLQQLINEKWAKLQREQFMNRRYKCQVMCPSHLYYQKFP